MDQTTDQTTDQATDQATDQTTDQATDQTTDRSREQTLLEQQPTFVNPDGTFADNWRDMLPDDLKEAENLKNYKDVPNLAKALVNAQHMVGKDKVVVPNEKSKPEEWDAFYTAIGRPKTPDDYQVEVPEDLQDIFTSDRIKGAAQLAHELGISQSQFAKYMAHEMESATRLLEQQEAEDAKAKTEAEDALRKEFGAAYDQRIHVANRLIAEAMPKEEQRMEFLQRYGNDPDFIRFASIVGARLTESKAMVAELTDKTPQEVNKRIRQLQATPGYLDPSGRYMENGKEQFLSREQRDAITEELRELHKQLQPKQ